MTLKKPFFMVFCLFFGLGPSFAQAEGGQKPGDPAGRAAELLSPRSDTRLSSEGGLKRSFDTGLELYGKGKFTEASDKLRFVAFLSSDTSQVSQALYWIALAELSAGNYKKSLEYLDALENFNPKSSLAAEIPYHRGRNYYYQGKYEEAIVVLSAYAESLDGSNRASGASALYWVGESLYALGQLDMAADVFAFITEKYPESVKYEASSYRMDLINQKKIEAELLSLLKWSHEESLKTLEDYRRREKSYDQAIAAYRRRGSQALNGVPGEASDGDYGKKMIDAELRIAALEMSLAEASAALEELKNAPVDQFPPGETRAPLSSAELTTRLLLLKAEVLELRNVLTGRVNGGRK